jgi:putative cell wall-binding protein
VLAVVVFAMSIATSAFAAVSFVGVGSATGTWAEGTTGGSNPVSIVMPVPSGNVGDLLLCQVNFRGGSTGTIPVTFTGWTLLDRTNSTNADGQAVYYRVADGTEPANYTWTYTDSANRSRAAGNILRYRGVDTATAPVITGNSGTASPATATGLTTTVANTWIVPLFGNYNTTTIGATTGTTNRYAFTAASSGPSIRGNDQTIATAGATGNKTATVGTGGWVAHLVALKPVTVVSTVLTVASANQPAGILVAQDTTHSVDGFTLQRTAGAAAISASAVTIENTGTTPSTVVSGVDVYLDNGDNVFGPGDTLLNAIPATFSGSSVTVPLSPAQSINDTAKQYWVVYHFDPAAADASVASSRETSVTQTGATSVTNNGVVGKTFTVDALGPDLFITSPVSGEVLTGTSKTIVGTATDPAGVFAVSLRITRHGDFDQFWNGSAWQDDEIWVDASGTTLWSYVWNFDPASQDNTPTYDVDAISTDLLGNGSAADPVLSVTIDNVNPTVAITSPAIDDVLTGTTKQITGTAADTGSGVSTVSVSIQRDSDSKYWDGATWVSGLTWLKATGTDSWTYDWTFDPASQDGSPKYTIGAKAEDVPGNVGTATDVTGVTVDNVGPVTAISTPLSGAMLTGSSKEITGTATDAGSGVASVELTIQRDSDSKYWDGSGWVTAQTWVAANGTDSWTYSWVFDPANQDATPNYTIIARGTDNAGNTGADSASVTDVAIDNVGPVTAVTAPANGEILTGSSFSIEGTSTDGSSGQTIGVSIQRSSDNKYWDGTSSWVDAETWLAATGSNTWSYLWTFDPASQDGSPSYSIRARGTDVWGNVGDPSPTISGVIIDNTAPNVAITSPASDDVLAGYSKSITGTASDGVAVDAVTLKIQRSSDSYYWDGSTWVSAETWLDATGTNTWSYDWTYDPANQNGSPSYTITAHAVDTAHNGADSAAVTGVTIDNIFTITPATGLTGGHIDPSVPEDVNSGSDSSTYTITPDAGYRVNQVLEGATPLPAVNVGGGVFEYKFKNVTADHTITATFTKLWTITASAGSNGTIDPTGEVIVDEGANQTFTFHPATGYHVYQLTLNGGSAQTTTAVSYQFTNVIADNTINVTFAINSYTISKNAGPNGSIDISNPAPTFGQDSVVTVTPNANYHIASATLDGVPVTLNGSNQYVITNIQANHTFAATFASNVRPVERVGGNTRYDVTVATAQQAYPGWTGVKHVVLASGEDRAQPDALTAAGLAGVLDAPLMLVPYSSVNTAVENAVKGMPAGVKVHIVGGPNSVSSKVESQLRSYGNVASVDRTSGSDRYGTAAAVARRMKGELVAQGKTLPPTTLITNGNFPNAMFDALTASAISAHNYFPVLLVRDGSVPAVTSQVLAELGLTQRYIIGGTTSVKPVVASNLGVSAGNRISGATRYSTATAAANRAKAEGWLANTLVGFAAKVPDAATGGAFMGKKDGALVYVTSKAVPGDTASYLSTNKASITQGGVVFGGTTSIPESVRTTLENLLK